MEFNLGSTISSVLTGIFSSLIIAEIYRRIELKRQEKIDFNNEKQEYSKYIGTLRYEVDFYSKKEKRTPEDTQQLLRVIREPHWYNSFKPNMLDDVSSKILEEANDNIGELETCIINGGDKLKLFMLNVDLFKSQIDILKLKRKF